MTTSKKSLRENLSRMAVVNTAAIFLLVDEHYA
jgi:hypothetical protein